MASLPSPAKHLAVSASRWPLPLTLFAVAAALRLLAFVVFYLGSVLTGHHGTVDPFDPAEYDRWGWYAAQQLLSGHWVDLRPSGLEASWDVGFTYLVALEYIVVGHHPEVARMVNCFLAAFSSPAIYLAAKQAPVPESVARRSGWLVAMWPLSIYWAGYDLLKDPLIWFALSIAILALAMRTWTKRAGLGAFAFGCVYLVRIYMGPLVALSLTVGALLRRDLKGFLAVLGALALVQAALMAAGYPPVWSPAFFAGNGQAVSGGSISGEAVGQPALLASLRNPQVLTTRTIKGTATVLLGPRFALKDIIHPTLDSGMYPGMAVWIALIPFTALGFWRALKKRDSFLWSLAFFVFAIWGTLALAYVGQAFRQREMAFPGTLLFTSIGLERPWPRSWWWVYAAYWFLGVAVLVARELGLI